MQKSLFDLAVEITGHDKNNLTEFQENEIDALVQFGRRVLLSVERAPEWIPVSESIPHNGNKVLISFRGVGGVNCQAVAWFDRGLWWLNAKHALDRNYEPVHYWMSLPDDPASKSNSLIRPKVDNKKERDISEVV